MLISIFSFRIKTEGEVLGAMPNGGLAMMGNLAQPNIFQPNLFQPNYLVGQKNEIFGQQVIINELLRNPK
jgi:hypothetical protein